jgi:transposase
MANRGLEMSQIRQIIRLHIEGKSCRKISKLSGFSRKSVKKYIDLFKSSNLNYISLKDMSDLELAALMNRQEAPNSLRLKTLQEQFPEYERELKKVGVTKLLLWSEYKEQHPDGYNQTQFYSYYKQWSKTTNATMRFEHKVGDKMYVDFTGKKLGYTDKESGNFIPNSSIE